MTKQSMIKLITDREKELESRFLQLRLEKRNNAKRAAEMYGYSSDFYIMYKTEFGELLNILQDCR